jgi:hypothetical protein
MIRSTTNMIKREIISKATIFIFFAHISDMPALIKEL